MASPEEMAASMRNNLAEKTGKNFDEWQVVVAQSKLEKHGQIVKMLKADHQVTHGFANLIAHDFLNANSGSEEPDLIAAQYSGAKQDLKIIYDALIEKVSKFGDVEVSPKKAYVSLRRKKQFAIIQPSTKTRVDVGINLKGEAPTERLEASGSFNAMVSHRVRVTDLSQVDNELANWLKQAYELS
ncbi:DUF5655 domain-containing protein [Aliikangiella coralliicola]|uniref:DUF4287 domain-containing protein n=1 Tax=Aliikangiella coralliicola TaxID=2592383 RepID=A0A545UG99_9GAMM|nr:DUF5655 domain-containing protein [Aliikangiella coralliicola]TQV88504.1 DUF4287 domain-containing protein [Aliikangiella coralliicola]